MSNNLGSQQLSIPSKRITQVEHMPHSPGSQQLSISNKRTTQMLPMSHNLGSQQFSVPSKRMSQMVPMSNNLGSQQLSVPNKRMAQIEPMSSNLGSPQLSVPIKRTTQMEPSPKGQNESFESVRAKLRESLAASLALVPQQQRKLLAVGKNSQGEAASTLKPADEETQLAESASKIVDVASRHIPEKPLENLSSKDEDCAQKLNDGQSSSQEIVNENTEAATQTSKCDGQEFQLKYALLDEDVSFGSNFLIKDELLQGNGLCWASDIDLEVAEAKESHCAKRPKLVHEDVGGDGGDEALPQTLATKIEAELFKLFGGVNKKYKEKGRSLLFNLKDRSNPELRERVISGEISPERLCSMTAEELASKELSQWRIAKAEELQHMVVLPDSDVDIRRLVKKTHKGEFQVEFEQDDSVSVEVTLGASSLSQFRPKTGETEAQLPSKPNETETSEVTRHEKANLEDQSLQSSVTTIPHDGTDLMQGLMVDELKDAEFLPPIVSLDEFMESLDSEPPFENLPVDGGQTIPISGENKSSDVESKLESADLGSIDPVDSSLDKSGETGVKYTRTHSNLISSDIHIESEATPPSKGEHVWEGLLQLSISAMVRVIGFFKSGEKTSTNEWPNFLEIKGRVRLDAFEKFLQELPMSRSRAIMVVQFCCKEGSPESGSANLSEVVDSYVVDERVGFAEPAPGVELYFCPPDRRTVEMLGKHLPKDHTETLNATDNGLIGIVVWRKALVTSTISPNSSSHHKQSSKKQHHLRRQQGKNANSNAIPIPPLPMGPPPSNPAPPPEDEPIDDVPPGFGPPAAKDEDDLPEFDFVRGSNLPVSQFSAPNSSQGPGMAPVNPPAQLPPRPVEQMRELIHKYGHSEMSAKPVNWQQSRTIGVEVQPWNDDDDIPEWQPQPQHQQQQMPPLPPPPPPPQPPVNSFQPPALPPYLVNQQHLMSVPHQQPPHHPSRPFMQQLVPRHMSLQSLQPPMNMMQGQQDVASPWQPVPSWAPQSGSRGPSVQANGLIQPCNFGGPPVEGQFYGAPAGFGGGQNSMDWRPDVPRSRGF